MSTPPPTRPTTGRRLARVAAACVALGVVTTLGSPVGAAPADKSNGKAGGNEKSCTQYGDLVAAPEGMIPRDDHIHVEKDPLEAWAADHAAEASDAVTLETDEIVTIPVYFHVIRKAEGGEGDVPQEQVVDQIEVLNAGFAGTGFQFVLEGTTRTTSPQWFNLLSTQGGEPRFLRGSSKEVKMKSSLRQGDAQTLNIYSSSLAQSLLGWAYLPWDFTGDNGEPLPRYLDGVVVDYRSLPGGAYGQAYGLGDTGTHEVGHWLGLFHTFQNGCEGEGDHVDDTPYEASPAFRCPADRDTCPQPGMDPVTNFMDYTWDSCMNHFTEGQAERMRMIWAAHRSA